MNPRKSYRLLPLVAVLLLSGCLQDAASYQFPEKDHAITLMRNQPWFWLDTVNIEVIAIRLPDCNDGISVKAVPRDASLVLHQAPDVYPEPIFILAAGKRHFAISTLSCRVQQFEEAPAELGERVGQFREKDGKFRFVADAAAASETAK